MVRAAALILLLAGCGLMERGSSTAEIADVNARNALARIQTLSSEVAELKREVENLKLSRMR
jgi:hypothetical protein